jgi:hypothetical protein
MPEESVQMKSTGKEAIVGALLLLIAIPFALTLDDIYVDPSDPGFGSQDFPRLTVYLIIVLSGFLLLKAVYKFANGYRETISWTDLRAQAASVGLLSLMAFGYVWAITLFQYALPTLVILSAMIYFFGSRSPLMIIVMPLILVGIYYFVFFVIFGLFEDPGKLLSYDSYSLALSIRKSIGL